MLRSLSIENVLLIGRLELGFETGLCVLTGETGAGKSILIDSLGLVLGARADAKLIRPGESKASVAAAFSPELPDAVRAPLDELGIEIGDELLLRRVIGSDGRSRAFVNDTPVNIGTLKSIGGALVEIVGQDESDALLDPSTHRALLDAYGGHEARLDAVARGFARVREAEAERRAATEALSRARRDEDYLRHALAELDALDPKPGEEAALAEARSRLQHGERIAEAMAAAEAELGAGGGVPLRLRAAQRLLERAAAQTGGHLDGALEAIERAAVEAGEALDALEAAIRTLDLDPSKLEKVEERLFALRAAARKHQTDTESLPALRNRFAETLAALDGDESRLHALEKAYDAAWAGYLDAARELSEARRQASASLDAAVAAELKPLKLGQARFETQIETLGEADASPLGLDRVRFAVQTVPGAAPGPLQRIASGGERSRFTLALRLALARASGVGTLIFDEVDAGVGGAVADAVGERLARLARHVQVLTVTHSPQVAARGGLHLCVRRRDAKGRASTDVEALEAAKRREEIARMLSGARVTDEARAAADSLIAGRRA
ncbi:MAG: DNA repair protein RecN [Alphaproteobacteria bacterium]